MKRSERTIAFWVIGLCSGFEFVIVLFLLNSSGPYDPTILRGPFKHLSGNAYVANIYIPGAKPDTAENWTQSTLNLYEDGKPLGPAHSEPSDIAETGRGLYFFRKGENSTELRFSTSDTSDPNVNGRTYRVFDPQARDPYEGNLRR